MFYAFIVIVMMFLFISNAYAIWYAKSGRYEQDCRLDTITRHKAK